MKNIVLVAIFAVQCAACSTIVEGPSQKITIITHPEGARCTLNRENEEIARIPNTPGSVTIEKTKNDITILCDKQGFEQGDYSNHSGAAAATFGNLLAGGAVGWIVDSATGSDNKYDGTVTITLSPQYTQQSQPQQQTPGTVQPQPVYAEPQSEPPDLSATTTAR